jgi:hypothetical protein
MNTFHIAQIPTSLYGTNIQSEDGKAWQVASLEATAKYMIHVNHNGTLCNRAVVDGKDAPLGEAIR